MRPQASEPLGFAFFETPPATMGEFVARAFGISRSEARRHIQAGAVRVEWSPDPTHIAILVNALRSGVLPWWKV